jgi:hypothetical protein
VLLVPGNHDIEWWRSPLGLLGDERSTGSTRYRRSHAGARGARRDQPARSAATASLSARSPGTSGMWR